MRAYLAVLKDSFREALASRVLWILLALTTLVLAAVAPIGLSEKPATQLRRNSILNMSALVSKIETQGRADDPSPGKQIWSRWGDDLKTRLANREGVEAGNVPVDLVSDLLDALNKLLPDRKFYDPPAWRGIDLNDETKALAERGVDSLTDDEVKRRNRLLLEMAYPTEIASGKAELSISYLVWPVTESPALPDGSHADHQGDRGRHHELLRGNAGSACGYSRHRADHSAHVRAGRYRSVAQQADLALAVVSDEVRRWLCVHSAERGLFHHRAVADPRPPIRPVERAAALVHSHISVSVCDLLRGVVPCRRPVAQCGRFHRRHDSVLGGLFRGGDHEDRDGRDLAQQQPPHETDFRRRFPVRSDRAGTGAAMARHEREMGRNLSVRRARVSPRRSLRHTAATMDQPDLRLARG